MTPLHAEMKVEAHSQRDTGTRKHSTGTSSVIYGSNDFNDIQNNQEKELEKWDKARRWC